MTEGDSEPRREKLVTTAKAAKQLDISPSTLLRYAERGYVTPAMTLPSGHRRWDVEDVRRQLRELVARREHDDDA